MKRILILGAVALFSSLSASAQLQETFGPHTSPTQTTRGNFEFSATGRAGQNTKADGFQQFALTSEVTAATGGAITNVNGQTGPTVTLRSSDVAENVNLYYTQTRARTAIAGSGKVLYNATTGVISLSALSGADVGLDLVNNTSDANKPVSTATAAALATKEAAINAGTLNQYFAGDKTFKNTIDLPVSTATQTALNAKADVTSIIVLVKVADRAGLDALTVPAGTQYLVRVTNDNTQVAPYNVNSYYFKATDGTIDKLTVAK